MEGTIKRPLQQTCAGLLCCQPHAPSSSCACTSAPPLPSPHISSMPVEQQISCFPAAASKDRLSSICSKHARQRTRHEMRLEMKRCSDNRDREKSQPSRPDNPSEIDRGFRAPTSSLEWITWKGFRTRTLSAFCSWVQPLDSGPDASLTSDTESVRASHLMVPPTPYNPASVSCTCAIRSVKNGGFSPSATQRREHSTRKKGRPFRASSSTRCAANLPRCPRM